ncbi:MAG: glucose-1-phosphate thymidylyltransferase, partial [Draconibacterium sp.]|nr:glucose-1-phosphate thymidylyltransferase [Draconibacterium sp.]
PFALGEHSTVKLASKIYGPTTIGPYCKAGGEINNSILQAYSNKGHDGFLGNSVIGEWCNLGADTNTSNLKNNYAEVKLWSYPANRFVKTGLQFCGLIMGDHSKCSINTMFNTGTVVGVSANIFGTGFPRNFIPSFAWGGSGGMVEFKYEKAAEVAVAMMKRREIAFDEYEQQILKWVFTHTANFRNNLK